MNGTSEEPARIDHILVCGGGLAAHMTVAALSHQLPPSTRITLVTTGDAPAGDMMYGSVTAPSAYEFNLAAGVTEPRLVLESDAAFSWGTKYAQWAGGSRTWIQCFHLPLPVIDGVMFHHYLAQQGVPQLERFLVPAAAGRKGAFMHPPQAPGQAAQQLLARAEYGYQFDPAFYARLFKASRTEERVRQVGGEVDRVECDENGIASIYLSDGQSLTADLYVDCTGPQAALLSHLGSEYEGQRRLRAAMSRNPAAQLGPPLRTVTAGDYGWRADTPLRGCTARLTAYDPDSESEALAAHGGEPEQTAEITLGRRAEAWSGNCVGIGLAARCIEPLTPAPIMLLQGDIERLLSLIPFSVEMSVERREFNRRFAEDHEHAQLFTRALFEAEGFPDTPYWRAARAERVSEKLARKIELFEDRGLLVAYDLEPFHPEDWTIMHYGMGRRPGRHDRPADRAPSDRVQAYLSNMKRDVDKTVEGLPSHAAYMAELKHYLMQNRR